MKTVHNKAVKEQPLMSVLPGCYQRLLEELLNYNLHAYDVKAGAVPESGGFHIVLRFGDDLAQAKRGFFTHERLDNMEPVLIDFFREAGQACKRALIADYYKMMKP